MEPRRDVTPANPYEGASLTELIDGIAETAWNAGRCVQKETAARSIASAQRWGERCDGYRERRDAQVRELRRRLEALGVTHE